MLIKKLDLFMIRVWLKLIDVHFFRILDFLSEAYKEEVKFNIFEYAAQKILKF